MKKPELFNSDEAAAMLGWPERGSRLRGMVQRFPADGTGPRGGKLFTRATIESWEDVELPVNVRVEKHIFEAIPLYARVPDAFRYGVRFELSNITDSRQRIPKLLGYLTRRDLEGWQILRHVANWPGRKCGNYIIDRLGRCMMIEGIDRDGVVRSIPWFRRLLNPRLDIQKTLDEWCSL